jgi:hypothetical protein
MAADQARDSTAGAPDDDSVTAEGRSAAAAALREAFTRLQPQGSDAWNFLGAFTHLSDQIRPRHPDESATAEPTPDTPDTLDLTPDPPGSNDEEKPRSARRGVGLDRVRRFMARGVEIERAKAELARTRAELGETRAELGETTAELARTRAELGEAVAHVVEAFRFLSSRVDTLEARLAAQDHPIDGAAWLAPARELGAWVDPIAAHVVDRTPGGEIVHADCGDGRLIATIEAAGVRTQGVEPRGDVALQALEQGCRVTICEALEHLSVRAPRSLGGIVLSGVVDRLPVAAVVPLLAQCRRTLATGAPLVVVAEPRGSEQTWQPAASEILAGQPLHEATWQMLIERAGFAAVGPLSEPSDADGDWRLVLAAAATA